MKRAMVQLAVAGLVLSALGFQFTRTSSSNSNNYVAPRITKAVDENQRVTLKGNTHPLARPQYDRGTAPADLPLNRMLLVLKRSPEQESALRQLLDEQQDKRSPHYHKWLKPDEFGQQFGPADQDIQTTKAWLQQHGFQIGKIARGRTVIEFSGNAAQVQEAFGTAIHKYVVNGKQHWANGSDPQIPAALTPVVAGVFTMHDFRKKPMLKLSAERLNAKYVKGEPLTTFPGNPPVHALSPWDYSIIYNTVVGADTGSGVTIAVVGRSNLFRGGQDVQNFATLFGLWGPTPTVILNGPDPGDLGGGEEAEATLDTSWATASALQATVDLVVSASTNTTDGVDLSELYIIDNNVADVMTESFGICEAALTSSEGAQIAALAQQAAAQGITYIVSSGDSGAEGCDDPNSEIVASGPLSVNALASTPYTVAVGGTIFNENKQDSKYWSSANGGTLGSALSYIPENAWNESCTAGKCGKNAGIWAGGGGASSLFAKPSWQSGVAGIPNDHARDVPDVSLAAGSHDAYLLCLGGSCVPDAKGNIQLWLVSGTSAAAPSFASIMALVDANMEVLLGPAQKRQGQANYSLYAVAALNPSTCNGSSTTSLPTSNCIFNDTTIGNNAVPGEIGYGSISARYQSGKGYDLATGLGSVNAGNLVRQWPAASFQATSTSLSLTPSPTTITHGQLVTVNIAVSSTSAGTPTGDVSLLTDAGQSVNLCVSPGGCTLSSGALSAATYLLPGYKDSTGNPVTYNIHAHYAGDGTFSPSDSGVWPVTVSPEPSTTTLSLFGGSTISPVPFLSGVSSSLVFLRADVTAQSLVGTATGSVVFMDGGTPIGSPYELTSAASTITPNGISGFLPGQHTITAQYSGDGSFNSSLSNAVSFTIIPDFALAATLPSLVIGAPGQSGTLKVMVNGQTGFNGTMKFTGASCAGLPVEASCSFTPSSVTGSGSTILTVTTAGPHAVLMIPQRRYLWSLAAISFAFGLLLPCAPQKRRRWAKMVGIISVLVLSVAVGCGSGGTSAPSDPGTPAGSYPVTVTASTGTLTHTVRFTLLIQ